MSSYASEREVREVIKATLQAEGRDPEAYNVSGIVRDAFYSAGYYGWRAQPEPHWHAAVTRHKRSSNGGVRRGRVPRARDCEGHESLAGEHMGESVYCDGSCQRVRGTAR